MFRNMFLNYTSIILHACLLCQIWAKIILRNHRVLKIKKSLQNFEIIF